MSFVNKLGSIITFALVILGALVLAPLVIVAFLIMVLWHEPRIAVGIALCLLMATAISLAAGGQGIAEGLATYAYFFLASGVVFMVVKYVKERRVRVEDQTSGEP